MDYSRTKIWLGIAISGVIYSAIKVSAGYQPLSLDDYLDSVFWAGAAFLIHWSFQRWVYFR